MKNFLIFFLFFFSFNTIKAQNTDSLLNLLEKTTETNKKAEVLFELCKANYHTSLNSAVIYLEKLLKLAPNIKNTDFLIQIYQFSGSLYRAKGDYEKALEHDLKGLKLLENNSNQIKKAKLLNNVGIDFYRLYDYTKALKYFKESQIISINNNDSISIGNSYNNIGMIYDDMNKLDSALMFYKKAKKIYTAINEKDAIADVLNNFAGVFYKKNNFDKVLLYAQQSLEIQKELGNKKKIAYTLINIGVLYFSIKNYSKAIEYELEGIKVAEEIGSVPLIRFGSKNIAEAYAKINDFENAYKFHLKYSVANDSIFNKDKVSSMNDMQTKYETEKKEQQISILEKEANIRDLKIQKITILLISTSVLIVLILSIIVILYRQNKQKEKINKLLETKNDKLNILNATKDKFFAIISHDLKNPLSAFCNITNSLETYFNEIEKDELHNYIKDLNKSSAELQNLLQNLLQWAAMQNNRLISNPEKINLPEIINENISLLKNNADKKQIKLNSKIQNRTTIYADVLMIKTVFRNLLSNAIKFTEKNGKIEIMAKTTGKYIEIELKDNGIGINQEDISKLFRIDVDTKKIGNSPEKGTGLGLILAKEMLEKNNGQISVKSKIGKGTSFFITLPKN